MNTTLPVKRVTPQQIDEVARSLDNIRIVVQTFKYIRCTIRENDLKEKNIHRGAIPFEMALGSGEIGDGPTSKATYVAGNESLSSPTCWPTVENLKSQSLSRRRPTAHSSLYFQNNPKIDILSTIKIAHLVTAKKYLKFQIFLLKLVVLYLKFKKYCMNDSSESCFAKSEKTRDSTPFD